MARKDNLLVALFKLTRFEHSIMLVIAVLAAELIAGGIPATAILLLSMAGPIFNSAGAFAINDYYDVEADRANKMFKRPLVNGSLSRRTAFAVSMACFAIAIAASALINVYAFIIILVTAVLDYYYSARLKDMPFVGNFYVAFGYAIPFVYGAVVVATNTLSPVIILIFFVALLSGLGREIHGAIRDKGGDVKARGAKNLVYHLGDKKSASLALILYAEAIAISEVIFFYVPVGGANPFALNATYIVPVTVANLLVFYVAAVYVSKPAAGFHKLARNLSLGAMALVLITYLFAILFPIIV